jgi:asparagine synthase (glutamine-hydrolysing)
MCGISGMLKFGGSPVHRDDLRLMNDVQAHRGPDGEGIWIDGSTGLGHRRLSIIDLSDAAAQPMEAEDSKSVIVFNGEIYNYRELAAELAAAGLECRTHSDTEVILNLYRLHGPGLLGRLRGMFAFAIWDRQRQELFLARDRIGIKPLYYLHNDKAFVFASEIKAIAASRCSSLTVNRRSLTGLMRFLVVPQPDTIFSDIHKLEPGRYLRIAKDGTIEEKVYWQPLSSSETNDDGNEGQWIEDLTTRLQESVNYHMVADVPVGAFLSGGLDSSAVVTLMRKLAPQQQLNTFSIGFPGLNEYDEERFAKQVATLNSANHLSDTLDRNFLDDIDTIAWHLDEPFAIHSAYATYYLAAHAARKTKVVLTGDGGDELFAGYEGYKNDAYLKTEAFQTGMGLAFSLLNSVGRISGSNNRGFLRALTGLRRRLGSEGLRYSEQISQNNLFANSLAFNKELFYPAIDDWKQNLVARYYDELETSDRLLRKLYTEYKTRLVDEMLMKVDRMTMAHSLEARVPLLDHHLVEFAFRVPSSLKLQETRGKLQGKYLLKKAMEPHLPEDIIYRKKQGFNIPVRTWMQGDFLNQAKERLLGGILVDEGVLDKRGVELLFSRHDPQTTRHYTNMFMLLLAFESWAGAYRSRIGTLSWSQ